MCPVIDGQGVVGVDTRLMYMVSMYGEPFMINSIIIIFLSRGLCYSNSGCSVHSIQQPLEIYLALAVANSTVSSLFLR